MPKSSALQEFLHKLELSFLKFYAHPTARLLPGVFYARNPEPVNLSGMHIRLRVLAGRQGSRVAATSNLMQNEQNGQ